MGHSNMGCKTVLKWDDVSITAAKEYLWDYNLSLLFANRSNPEYVWIDFKTVIVNCVDKFAKTIPFRAQKFSGLGRDLDRQIKRRQTDKAPLQ